MEAKHIVSDGNNTVVTCSDWPNLRGKGEDVRDQYGISQLVHSVQIDGEWPAQTVTPLSRPGSTMLSGYILPNQVLPPNLDIYCAFFCDPASNMGSREVSLVMEGSLIRSAIGDHWDFNKFLAFSCKPLWDVILYMVSNVPLPTPGKDLVLFAIEKCVLSVDAPPKDVLPHVEPLVQCLDVDNFLKLLTAVLHERRILLHSNKYLSEPCRDNSCLREVFTFNPSIKGHMSFDLSL
ncbi:C-MYC PROMOTER BINDING PROTEIN [Salix purpurea]|uniref:C-MYC PROMOTER BINDING PROTEIN n=1 Tax=Salix purpurea TaxID=77065 RepID=A0A9Q0V951_SALPP|nr:C-MYC PROMOTER BINDING PROTEIN [Salix purpurea]